VPSVWREKKVVIAIAKDLPDDDGDRQYKV
jgi:hypothetical protein